VVAEATAEPSLSIKRRPRFFRRSEFVLTFSPTALLAIGGLLTLLLSGNVLVPFQQILVLEGKVASKSEFFEDADVQRILLRHRISVHLTRSGSREIANNSVDGYDFVMPSGEPDADRILSSHPGDEHTYRPFVTPLVLATYREYAETLVDAGIATRQGGSATTLYYTLDTGRFISSVERQQTWLQLGIRKHGVENGNKVLAQSSDVCTSNSAGTYLGIVAFIKNNYSIPQTEAEADDLARRIKPIVTAQGMPAPEMFGPYVTRRAAAPLRSSWSTNTSIWPTRCTIERRSESQTSLGSCSTHLPSSRPSRC